MEASTAGASGRSAIARLAVLPLVLTVAILLAWRGGHPPAVRTIEAPQQFSTQRAAALVADIARAPHRAGSAEHARVRDLVAGTLRGFGLQVEIQRSFAVRQTYRFGSAIAAAPVENIIAVLPGRDRSQPAVAAMAHYDSVAFAPGAADDASGTAAILETARLLSSGPKPLRDVAFVITDSEELGLLGAHVFFSENPLAKQIGAVVNVEARGSRGLATMFQTSPGNAALVDLWAENAIAPSGNSLTGAVYRLLPNDTDLTVALAADKIGINSAFIDGQFDYHAPSDAPANLDPRTLQQLGDFALTTTRALAFAPTLPERSVDSAYFDVFGLAVVRYPIWLGWALLALGVLGFATLNRKASGASWREIALGALWVALITLVAGGASHLVATVMHGEGAIAMRERLAEGPAALWMYLAMAFGFAVAARPGRGSWQGAIALLLVIALVAQLMLPGANWLFIWPALIALVLAHIAGRAKQGWPLLLVTAIAGGLTFALVAQVVIAAYVGLGSMTPAVIAPIVPFFVALLGPLLLPWTEGTVARPAGAVLLVGAAAGAALFVVTDGFSPRQPRPGDLFHLADADTGKSWWATTSSPAELPKGDAQPLPMPISSRFMLWATPAPALDTPRPAISMAGASGRFRLHVTTAQVGRLVLLSLRPSVALTDARLNGKPIKLDVDKWTPVSMRAAVPADLVLEGAAGPGTIEVRYLTSIDGLPPGQPQPAGPPTNWTPFSGTRAMMGTARFALP